jgi:hypothetical protein
LEFLSRVGFQLKICNQWGIPQLEPFSRGAHRDNLHSYGITGSLPNRKVTRNGATNVKNSSQFVQWNLNTSNIILKFGCRVIYILSLVLFCSKFRVGDSEFNANFCG